MVEANALTKRANAIDMEKLGRRSKFHSSRIQDEP